MPTPSSTRMKTDSRLARVKPLFGYRAHRQEGEAREEHERGAKDQDASHARAAAASAVHQ